MTVIEFFDSLDNLDNTVYDIEVPNRFEKQVNLLFKRGLILEELLYVIHILAKDEKLEVKHKIHVLKGYKEKVWECYIKLDRLLMWKYSGDNLVLMLLETGTHADLF